jgi:hypothetical protein
MPDDSESSYDIFAANIRIEWKKLSETTQEDMFEEIPETRIVLGEFLCGEIIIFYILTSNIREN